MGIFAFIWNATPCHKPLWVGKRNTGKACAKSTGVYTQYEVTLSVVVIILSVKGG